MARLAIEADNEDLEWTVTTGKDKRWPNSISVSVRHLPSGSAGWAMRKTESEARDMALKRLNFYLELAWNR